MPGVIRQLVLRLAVISAVLIFIAGCGESAKKTSPVSLYVDAVSLAGSNEPNRAIDKLNLAVKEKPDFAIAYSLLGSIYLRQNDLPQSVQAYQRATEINPWSYEDFRDLGKVYNLMNDFNSSAKAFTKACELDPQSSEVLCEAADSYYKLGDYEMALKYGQSAKELAPSDSEIQKLLGDIYTARQDNELAIESYKRALELKAGDPNVQLQLAVVYLRAGQYEPAKQLLESVAAVQSSNAEVWRHLGFVYLKLNEVDAALARYFRAVQLAPDDWRGRKGLGVAYMMKYRDLRNANDVNAPDFRTKALANWRRSLDLNPSQDNLLKLYRKYTSAGGETSSKTEQ